MKFQSLLAYAILAFVIPAIPAGLAVHQAAPVQTAPEESGAYYIRFQPGYKETVLAQVQQSGGEITYALDRLNTIAVSAPSQVVDAVRDNPHVDFIEPVPAYRLTGLPQTALAAPLLQISRRPEVTPWFVDLVQARDAWDVDRDGQIDTGLPDTASIPICIIDTGLWTGHDDLVGLNVSGISQISGENWDEDGSGHGTHVTGIVGAQNNGLGMIGVLPQASIFIVKIFNNAGQWVEGQSNLAAAVYACKDAGARIVNMSFAGGFSVTDQAALQDLYDNDNMLFFSTSANNGTAAVVYPGYYESVINIGSVDRVGVVSGFSQYPPTRFDPLYRPVNAEWDAVELVAGGQIVASTAAGNRDYPVYAAEVDGEIFKSSRLFSYTMTHGIFSGPLVDGNLCQADDVSPSWTGAVVLCERGVNTFSDKLTQVAGADGVAIMIYNNVEGEFAQNCSGCSVSLPSLRLTREEGLYLIANKLGKTIQLTLDYGDYCGLDCTGAYVFYNGTSQAAPAASAAAAWLWAACSGPSSISNIQIRELLRDTAQDLEGIQPVRGFPYGAGWDPATGWGIPQMKAALVEANRHYGNQCALPVDANPEKISVCTPFTTTASYTTTLSARFTSTTTLTLDGGSAGLNYIFSSNPVTPPTNTAVLSLFDLDTVATGVYTLTIRASEDIHPSNMDMDSVLLELAHTPPAESAIVSPATGSTGTALRPTYTWATSNPASIYEFELALDSGFNQVIEHSEGLETTSYQGQIELEPGTIYFWRVTAKNACGNGIPVIATFRTVDAICFNQDGATGGLDAGTQTVFTDTIDLPGTVIDLNIQGLQGTHDDTAQLMFWLASPNGRAAKLVPGSCPGTNFSLSLDDRADDQLICLLNDGGLHRPLNALANFTGGDARGDWLLIIANSGNSGSLAHWNLEICTAGELPNQDYSDLPASYSVAWHTGSGTLRLGNKWSSDIAFADGQDNATDDGITTEAHWWESDSDVILKASITGGDGWLAGWADWNNDGDFEDGNELITDQAIVAGSTDLIIHTPPSYYPAQPVHLRFRLFSEEPLPAPDFEGGAVEGEVEDYWWQFIPTAVRLTNLRAMNVPFQVDKQTAFYVLVLFALFSTLKIIKKAPNP